MSYDQERKAIFEELISAIKQIDKEYPCVGAKGKDGIGVQLAVKQQNVIIKHYGL